MMTTMGSLSTHSGGPLMEDHKKSQFLHLCDLIPLKFRDQTDTGVLMASTFSHVSHSELFC